MRYVYFLTYPGESVLCCPRGAGPMDNIELKEYRAKRGMEILHFPTVLGAVVPAYNVPERLQN
jgi:hypothetical protein